MRRGLVHALAWSLATGAAVTLSWWGVHTVLSGTAYDPPRALPLPAGPGAAGPVTAGGDPRTSSTRRPETTDSTGSTRTAGSAASSGTPAATAPGPERPSPPSPAAAPSRTAKPPAVPATTAPATPAAPTTRSSHVKSYPVDGGRVTFDLGETSAELVSATPASGWRMQVWKQPTWIRVTFTKDGRELSVFCVWHDTAPRVEIEDRQT